MANSTAESTGIGDYFGAVRRRYIYLITLLPAAVFVSIVAAFVIPPMYQSTATIMLELSSVPKDIIETTVISAADQQIEIVQGRVMTVDSLLGIVRDIDPYPTHKEWTTKEKAQRVLDSISLERVDAVTLKPTQESNAFSLHYDNPDPEIAEAIDSRLAQLFVTYNQLMRTQAATEAAGFLQKQSEGIASQMRDVDVKIAEVKRKYGEAMPELLIRNQAEVEDLQRQLDALQQQILTAQEKESVLALQLSQMSPNLITQSGDLTDVATVRAKLTEAEQRYTPDHPEVKRLRRALETLMAQTGGRSGAKQTANNPQYLLTEQQVRSAREALASLQAMSNSTRAKLEHHRELVQETPAAEREVAEVLRRKEALQTEYQHIQERLQSANLAETFESQQGGERFSMLRSPGVPRLPVYPNRVGLVMLGLVIGAALAGIAVALTESMDSNVRMAKDLVLPDGVVVLASIPFIRNQWDRRRRAIMLSSFVAAYSVAIIVVGVVIVSAQHHH
jgi:polysaccharide chain length determinant protein (PEP-CTERM system associated)